MRMILSYDPISAQEVISLVYRFLEKRKCGVSPTQDNAKRVIRLSCKR